MRGWMVVIVAAATLVSLPADANDRHRGDYRYTGSAVTFSYGYGYPFGVYRPWGPWGYYPSYYGVGVHVARPYRVRSARRERGTEAALKLYVYPAAGQSEQQLADDRYECHVWAADRSGHDPTLGAGSRREAEEYTRAFTACMEGRSYVVK